MELTGNSGGLKYQTPRGCSRYRGVLYDAWFIAKSEAMVFIATTDLSSAVVQTQHTTEPVTPTTIAPWLVRILYHKKTALMKGRL